MQTGVFCTSKIVFSAGVFKHRFGIVFLEVVSGGAKACSVVVFVWGVAGGKSL